MRADPDDVNDMGDTATALFGRSVAPVNLEAAPASDGLGSNDHEPLTSSTTGKLPNLLSRRISLSL